jgi:hypothetical protein
MTPAKEHVRFVVGLLAGALAGCGTYAVAPAEMPKLPTPAGAARICIVRRASDRALATFPIRDNSVLVGATISGSCFCYFAAAGKHEIEARSDGFDHVDIEVKAGAEIHIVQTTHAAVGIVRSRLEPIDEAAGKAALESCKYSVLTEVPDGTYKAKPEMVIVAK